MPNLNDLIDGYIAGDDLCVQRQISGIPSEAPVTVAWLTVRDLDDFDASTIITQLEITVTSSTSGQVLDTGVDTGIAHVRFELDRVRTRLVGIVGYPFDIQIQLSDLRINTPFRGTIKADAEVTQLTS